MNFIQKWRSQRQIERDNAAYTAGFQWAMAAYHLGDQEVEQIESQIDFPLCHDHYDLGIAYALHLIVADRQRQFELLGRPNVRRSSVVPRLRIVE